jgi:TonB family protein
VRPYQPKKRPDPYYYLRFTLIALFLHATTLPLLAPLLPDPDPSTSRQRALRLVEVTRSTNNQKRSQRSTERQKKPKREVPPEKLAGQIVDLPPSIDDTPPDEADYLSEHNTRTERETKSRHRQKDYRNAMHELSRTDKVKPVQKHEPEPSQHLALGPESPQRAKAGGQSSPTFEFPTLQNRSPLDLKLDPQWGLFQNQKRRASVQGNSKRLKLSLGNAQKDNPNPAQAPQKGRPKINLIPSVGVLAALSGAPANDHLEDVEEGEGTFLNSREFKYASFFNRLKRDVSQHWRPMVEYRRRDPTGHIYGKKSRVTIVQVVLQSDGMLEAVDIQRSSGVDFLDNEALHAFRRAQPFPNPPKGLIDAKTGLIDFPFGFHINFSRGGLRLPF